MDTISSIQKLNLVDLSGLIGFSMIKEKAIATVSDAEKISIEHGLNDLQTGKTRSHAQVKKRYEKWL